ncbi:DUF262 domain-containing protein [Granulicella cerasi]|uniref:DUF262 domain-containing protein n=1 Tax=Granulicella cerasi TaxID=741063 RepID=A0ABW1Z749_9BACT|nr:DUF262 domain-containing HNH endonuclease family protein [Granulicella cerasi]
MQITFDRKTVNTCLQQKFVLPTYQRDYKWEYKHLEDLLNDVQEAFLSARKPGDGRRDVLGYEPYFLGTIITTPVEKGGKAIVDGQQRITTLSMLLCWAQRFSRKSPDSGISSLEQPIRRRVAGESEFNLDMDAPRKKLFELLIDGPLDIDDLAANVDSIPNKDSGTLQLWELFQKIDVLMANEIIDTTLLPQFFDYLTECVYLFEIGVPREQDGHKVFVTMNDRGLKLSPIDLLKGFLLSSIHNDGDNRKAHEIWTKSMKKLKDLGSDEDSNFFKTWIRSKYAKTIRGKKSGDSPGDFEVVGDSYHRWLMDRKEEVPLSNSDDFSNLITESLPYYVDLYVQIKLAERTATDDLPHVYYNGARGLTLQAMVILSSVRKDDTQTVAAKKIRAISFYLDYLATVRILNGKENTYDNIRDIIFDVAKQVRDLPLTDLKSKLHQLIVAEKDQLDSIKLATYDKLKRQDLLHLLSRLTNELEESMELGTAVGFAAYIDRTKNDKTFDVEHLLPNAFEKVNEELKAASRLPFTSKSEFETVRNSIGGLILLPRGRNRSMKDMDYTMKLARYSNENILAQTLTQSFYLNQPNWTKFSQTSGVSCDHIPIADAAAIALRSEFYFALAKQIWGVDQLEECFN